MNHHPSTHRVLVKPTARSRYDVDVYGQPRILSKWEVILYAVARPLVIGVIIGYGLAISVVAVRESSPHELQAKAGPSQVKSLESQS